MKVLWFSSRPPLGAIGSKNIVGGSWIESLEHGMATSPYVKLGIVFNELVKEPEEIPSRSSQTRYFKVPRYPYSKFNRWYSRFMASPPSEKSVKHYLKVVDDFQPDVVLFFGTESDMPLIIPQLDVPSVIWFQGNRTVYQRLYQSGIPLQKTLRFESLRAWSKGETIVHDYLLFKHKVKREEKTFSVATNFIGRTSWDRRLVSIMSPQANYFHCDEPMRPIFWEKKWSQWKNRDSFIITTTIQSHLYKGLETVFEACHLLSERLPKKIEWRIMGISKDKTYVKAALRKAQLKYSDSDVQLLGRKSATELVDELLNSDVYVHPSHIENSPNAVQEAMLLGMPVIATNVGGTPSILRDDEEGLLVQNKDPYAMAGAILELFEFPEKAAKLGAKARERALVRNDNEKICSDLISIFSELIGTNRKSE